MVAALVKREYARGKSDLVQTFDRAIPQIKAFIAAQPEKNAVTKRAEYLIFVLEEAKQHYAEMIADVNAENLAFWQNHTLEKDVHPYNTWEGRRPAQTQAFENFIDHAGINPWALCLQEVTPQILADYKTDLAHRNIQWISYNIGSGQETGAYDPKNTDANDKVNRAMTITMAISDRLIVKNIEVGKLPEAVKGSHKPPRLIVGVELEDKITHRKFILINTHTDFRVSKEVYEETALAIQEFVKTVKTKWGNENIPIIFGGDLNMFRALGPKPVVKEEDSQAYYDSLKEIFPKDFRDHKLYAPYEFRNVSFIGFPGETFNPKWTGKDLDPNALDQFLTTDNVEIVYGVRDPVVFDKEGKLISPEEREKHLKAFQEGYTASDHIFQWASVKINLQSID